MQQKKRQIELANIVIKFGVDNLLDVFESKVWPVLENGRIKAKGETEYYKFFDIRVNDVDGAPAMYGRLVAKKHIESDQDIDDSETKLISAQRSISGASSSFFLITLSDHKLAFLRENSRAPSLSTLEYCVRRLLEDDWRKRQRVIRTEWLKKEKLSVVPQKRRQELNDFLDEVDPKPDVRITPLPSTKELNEHLKSYEVITSIKLTSFKTNSEFPDENDDFIKSLTGAQERLNSDKIKTDLSNNVGLDKNQSEKLLSAAANGNYAAELKGKDSEGHKLDGDLKSLAIKIEMLLSPREDSDLLASKVLNRMKAAITRGLVNVSESADSHLEKANKILNRIKAVTK